MLSLTEAKEHLNIKAPLDEGQHDDELLRFIEAVVPAVERHSNIKLSLVPVSVRLTARAGVLLLPDAPVASLTSITRVSGAAVDESTAVLDRATGMVRLPLHVAGVYEVAYVAGYDQVPPECRLAVAIIVEKLWSKSQRRPLTGGRGGAQQELEIVARGLFPSEALQLLPERVRSMA